MDIIRFDNIARIGLFLKGRYDIGDVGKTASMSLCLFPSMEEGRNEQPVIASCYLHCIENIENSVRIFDQQTQTLHSF